MTHIFYSFLTLAKHPTPAKPTAAYWDGLGLYESETGIDIINILNGPKDGPNDWQKKKIDAMMVQAKESGKKWIWSIGGWSDLTKTI